MVPYVGEEASALPAAELPSSHSRHNLARESPCRTLTVSQRHGWERPGHAGDAVRSYSTEARQASAGGQRGCNVLAEDSYMGKIIKPLC